MRIVLSLDGSVELTRGERITRGQDLSRRITVEWKEGESPIETGQISADNIIVQVCITRPDGEQSGWYIMLRERSKIGYYHTLTAWDTAVAGGAKLQIRWYDLTLQDAGEDATLEDFESSQGLDGIRIIDVSQEAFFIIDNGKIAQPVNVSSENYDAFLREVLFSVRETKDKVEELEQKLADFTYEPIQITSFYVAPSLVEKGASTSVVLSWATNKTPTAQTLDGATLDVAVRSATKTGVTANKTYTLKVTGEKGETDTRTATVSFYNGVYHGVASEPTSYNSAFILSLSKSLQSSKSKTFTVNAGVGQYIYYCVPTSYGTPIFTVGIFEGGFEKVETISFTNASGYTESYDIYKSENANLGATTVKVN